MNRKRGRSYRIAQGTISLIGPYNDKSPCIYIYIRYTLNMVYWQDPSQVSLDIYIAIINFFINRIFSVDHMQDHMLYKYIVFTIEILVPQVESINVLISFAALSRTKHAAECETLLSCMHAFVFCCCYLRETLDRSWLVSMNL